MNTETKAYTQKPLPTVFFGGRGAEHEISLLGAARFLSEARRLGREYRAVYIDRSGDMYLFVEEPCEIFSLDSDKCKYMTPTFPIRLCGKSGLYTKEGILPISIAILLLHGDYGEDGRMQGLADAAGIRFVGADTFAGAVASDKAFAKAVAEHAGVPVLPWCVVYKGMDIECGVEEFIKKVGYPIFVKPARLGSSVGASVAEDRVQLLRAIESAFGVAHKVMLEPALTDKRELECAYYSVFSKSLIAPPGEVDTAGRFYDYELKYSGEGSVGLYPRASVSDEVSERIRGYTKLLSSEMGISHLARFDYFLLPDGSVYFNEVNTFPGFTETSLYSRMLDLCGVSFDGFLEDLFDL